MASSTPNARRPAADTCHMYLVRHGATDNNLADPPKIQGQGANLGLSETGRRQASQVAALLAKEPLDAVYSSPLFRAMETAAAIAGPHDLVVQELPAILECDVGDWEGKSWVDIQQADPEAHRLFTTNPAEQGYRGGENLNQLLARVVPGLEQVMAENLGRTVATVAHNVVNRSYLAHVLGVPLSKARPITQNNCGVNVLRYRGGAVKMLSVNSIFHLEDWS